MLRFSRHVEVRSHTGQLMFLAKRESADLWRREGRLDLTRSDAGTVFIIRGQNPPVLLLKMPVTDDVPDQDRFRDLSAQPGERPAEWLVFGTPGQRRRAQTIIEEYHRCLR